jgi:hypothetical protein
MLEYMVKAQKLFTLSAPEKHSRIWFVPARKHSTSSVPKNELMLGRGTVFKYIVFSLTVVSAVRNSLITELNLALESIFLLELFNPFHTLIHIEFNIIIPSTLSSPCGIFH